MTILPVYAIIRTMERDFWNRNRLLGHMTLLVPPMKGLMIMTDFKKVMDSEMLEVALDGLIEDMDCKAEEILFAGDFDKDVTVEDIIKLATMVKTFTEGYYDYA